jgi:biopolymer transport protein ExbD
MAAMQQDDDGITGINVTPLVDVMLVLLIIFMVASTYIVKPSIEVDLPKAASAGDVVEQTLSLALKKDGSLYLNGEPASEAQIGAKCAAVAAGDPAAQAIIAADGAASHAQVVRLIDVVRTHGVTRFAINVDAARE